MRQRITLGGLSVTAAVCLAAFLLSYLPARPVLAQAAEKIREAKSYSFDSVMKSTTPKIKVTMRLKTYWQSPGASRTEVFRSESDDPDEVIIVFTDKPGIHIDHNKRVYSKESARRGEKYPLMALHELDRYSGEANRKLGRKRIGESVSEGFEIDISKIDPNVPSGTLKLWIDTKSKLPTQIDMQQGKMPFVIRMESFKWNEEFPPELFDTTPPEGYTDKTRPEEDVATQVSQITDALKLYAELSGGRYPKVKNVYGDATRDEMFGMAGIDIPPTVEQEKNPRYMEIQMATFGLARICVIQRDNPDAAFHGINVGPKDADKVLFRWKLPDGRYQVIYGDLRSEAVSAERLKGIE